MNSVGIDTFLKATQPAPKVKALSPANGSGSEFDNLLREAAAAQPRSTSDPTVGQAKSADSPTQSVGQDQGSTTSSDDQALPSTEPIEQAQIPLEEEPAEIEGDEVLLSVAAVVAEVPTDLIPIPDATAEQTEVVTQASAIEPAPALSEEPAPPAAERLPKSDSQEAVSQTPPVEPILPDDAAAESPLPPSEPATKPVTTPVVQQATAEPDAHQESVPDAPVVDSGEDADELATQAPAATQAKPQQTLSPTTTGRVKADESDNAEKENTDTKPAKASTEKQSPAQFFVAEGAPRVNDGHASPEITPKTADETAPTAPVTEAASGAHQHKEPSTSTLPSSGQLQQGEPDAHLPTIDRARFVQRVANAFRSAHQNDGQIQLRLSPPELGSLRIEIAVRNGVLSANLETETPDARRVLLDNLPALRQRLAEQDIRIDKFEVDIRREGGQPDGQAGAQDRQAQQQSQRVAAQNRIRTVSTPEVISDRVLRAQAVFTDKGFDVRI